MKTVLHMLWKYTAGVLVMFLAGTLLVLGKYIGLDVNVLRWPVGLALGIWLVSWFSEN